MHAWMKGRASKEKWCANWHASIYWIRLTEYTRSISFLFWRESTRDQCWIDPKVCCQWFAINWQQLHPGFIRLRYNNCTLQIVIYIYLSSCTVRCAVRLFPIEGRWAGKKSWKMNTVSITSCKERLGWLCLAFCLDLILSWTTQIWEEKPINFILQIEDEWAQLIITSIYWIRLTEYTRSISFYFGEKAPGINVELIQKYVANDLQSIGNNFTQAMRSKLFSK